MSHGPWVAIMRIAIVDLLFNWPPDGGARTDLKEIAVRAAAHHDVALFVPAFDYGFPRGVIRSPLPLRIHHIACDEHTFHFQHFPLLVKQALHTYNPDIVFVADGWFLKPYIVNALEEFRVIKRLYAYEGLCLRGHGFFFKDNTLCQRCFYTADAAGCYACYKCAREWLKKQHDIKFTQEFNAAVFCPLVYQKVVKKSFAHASTIIVYNDFIKGLLRRFNDDIRVIPSGVDTDIFKPGGDRGTDVFPGKKSICPDTLGKKNILMVGRSEDELKGFHILREAVRLLRTERDDFTVTVTSGENIQETIDEIHMVGWYTPERLPALYHSADICVVPSIWPEPFGIVSLEAMAMEKPVIVSDVGGLRETVEHGISGFVIPPGDSVILAHYLAFLLDNPERCRQMGSAGRQRVLSTFQWDYIYQTYYRDIFTEKG